MYLISTGSRIARKSLPVDRVHFAATPSAEELKRIQLIISTLPAEQSLNGRSLLEIVLEKPNPLAYSERLLEMSRIFPFEDEKKLIPNLAGTLSLEELKLLAEIYRVYKLHEPGTAQKVREPLSLFWNLYRNRDIPLESLKNLHFKIMDKVHFPLSAMTDIYREDKEAFKNSAVSILLNVLSEYHDKAGIFAKPSGLVGLSPVQDLEQGATGYFGMIVQLLPYFKKDLSALPVFLKNVTTVFPSPLDSLRALTRFQKLVKKHHKDIAFPDVLKKIFSMISQPDQIQACINEFEAHKARGGSIDTLDSVLSEKDYKQADPAAFLKRISPPIAAFEKSLKTRGEKFALIPAAYMTRNDGARFAAELPVLLETFTRFFSEFPKSLSTSTARKLIAQAPDLASVNALPARVKSILSRHKDKDDYNSAYKLVSGLLEESGDLERTQIASDIAHWYRQQQTTSYGSNAAISDLTKGLYKVYQPEIPHWETVTLKAAFHGISEEVFALLNTPENRGTPSIGAMRSGLSFVRLEALAPASMDRYCRQYVRLSQLLTPPVLDELMQRSQYLFRTPLTETTLFEQMDRLESMANTYRTRYPDPKEIAPLNLFLSNLLSGVHDVAWTKLFEGFPESVSSLTSNQRKEFMKYPFRDLFSLSIKTFNRFRQSEGNTDSFSEILSCVLTALPDFEGPMWKQDDYIRRILTVMLEQSGSLTEFRQLLKSAQALMKDTLPEEDCRVAHKAAILTRLGYLPSADREKVASDWLTVLKATKTKVPFLLMIMDPGISSISTETHQKIIRLCLEGEKGGSSQNLLEEMPGIILYAKQKSKYPEEMNRFIFNRVFEQPDNRVDTLKLLYHNSVQEFLKTHARTELKDNLDLLLQVSSPNRFLNTWMLNRDKIDPMTLYALYYFVEYGGSEGLSLGQNLLPELMAILPTFFEAGGKLSDQLGKTFPPMASGALTRVYNYIGSGDTGRIDQVKGVVLNNWARIGTLGLSFTKWQYDAMKRWKGQGPSQKPSLMEQSGLFTPLPPRENDKTYHSGFQYYHPETGVSIEMRRAYIVISRPNLGTLMIRNSSQVFGRDLFPEPAYYSSTVVLEGSDALLDPNNIRNQFESVLGKKVNQTSQQAANNERIKALLDAFDEAMEPYIAWKCGFKDGKPPAGFREILNTSMLSAKSDGAMTPFGKKKNIKPAWVNRFGLPFAVKSLDIADPKIQAEVALYLNVLEKRVTIADPKEYAAKIPNLLTFLQDGLSQNLELVLGESQVS